MSNDIESKRAKLQALLGGDPNAVKEVKNVMVAAEVVAEEKGLPTIPVKPIKKETSKGGRQVIVEEEDFDDDRVDEAFKKFNLRESVKSQYEVPPVVSEDATLALISGDRKKLKEIVSKQDEVERDIPQEKFDISKQLKERASKQLPKSKIIAESVEDEIFNHLDNLQHSPISKEEIREIVKEEIYNILSEVYKKEEENRLMTETIHIRIGETIFSGKLTPISKVKPKK